MIAVETQHRPNGEEADEEFQAGSGRFLHRRADAQFARERHQFDHPAREDEHTEADEKKEEEVKVPVVAFADAVAHPWTVVVETLDAVVAHAAMGRPRWTEYFAREAVFESDGNAANDHFADARLARGRGVRGRGDFSFQRLGLFF